MSQEDLDHFIELIGEDGTEVECGKYLKFVVGCMIKHQQGQHYERIRDSTEVIMPRGRGDFVISAKIIQSGGQSSNIFLWELKASNCHVFEFDNNARLKPSEFLFDAEHKLLNDYQSMRADDDLRAMFSPPAGLAITPNNVRMGGIIIGRNNNKIKDSEGIDPDEINRQYYNAIETRNIFYQNHITIYTWDDIIDEFRRVNIDGRDIERENILEIEVKPDTQYIKITR
jgi:hypothetical protein